MTHGRRSHKLPNFDYQPCDQVDVGKRKRKLTAAEKAAKQRRKAEFRTVFINGKQKRVRRPPTIDGMEVEEFIRRNADLIFLHEHEMWELMEERGSPTDATDEEADIF